MTIKKTTRKTFVFTPQMERILTEAIYPYHLLRAAQITRLLYPTPKQGMLTTVQTRLTELTDKKYLTADPLATATGPRPYIYSFGIKGKRIVEAKGLEVLIYYEPHELETLTFTKMHTLELNDFLILAATLEAADPRISFSDLEHALIFERKPLPYLEAGTGKLKTIKPDALFKLHFSRGGQTDRHYHCWVELDRGHVKDENMMKKFSSIYDFVKRGFFEAHYGKGAVRIFFVTTAGEKRLEHMRYLFRREFPEVNPASGKNQLFKFGQLPPLMQPKPLSTTVFCQPYWSTAYGDPGELQTIIDLHS